MSIIGADFMHSHDIDARILELEQNLDNLYDWELAELNELSTLKNEYRGPDWSSGVQFIHETAFTNYAKDICEDIYGPELFTGALSINWEKTAMNMKIDYTAVECGGYTYYHRS